MSEDPWEDAGGFGWLVLIILVILASVVWIMT